MTAEREPAFVGMYWIGAGLPLEARLDVPATDLPVLRARIITAVEHSPSATALRAALAIAAEEHGLDLDFEIADLGRGVVASVRMQPRDRIDVPRCVVAPAGEGDLDGRQGCGAEEGLPGTT